MSEGRFVAAQFELATRESKRLVNGWSDGTFGIDKRGHWNDNEDHVRAYAVTHLRTGYAVFGVVASLKTTQSLVKSLHSADWNFDIGTQPNEGCKLAAQAARDMLAVPVVSTTRLDSPDYIDTALAGEAGTATTVKQGAVHEHATAQPERPNPTPILPKKERP